MKEFEIPPPNFSLRSSDASYRNFKNTITEVTQYLEKKEKSIGTNGHRFTDAYNFLNTNICHHGLSIIDTVNSSIKVRALSKLISEKQISITVDDLRHLSKNNVRPSLLLISSISMYFFKYYDKLTSISINELGEWLQVAHLSRNKKISSSDKSLFSTSGVAWLLGQSGESGTLDGTLQAEGLNQYKGTRFYEIAQLTYYVKELEKLEPNETCILFDEIKKQSVYETQYEGDMLLGHKILEVLIDKIKSDVSEEWQKVVIKIAGDPRVPKDAENYRLWWMALGEARMTKVRGWLSKVDIESFLKVFDEYAKYKRNENMIRMYLARKTFLMGLLNKKQVLNTRLYLSPPIQKFLKARVDGEDSMPTNTRLKGVDMAIIYLDLGNGIGMVEGTHSFKCHLYKDIDSDDVAFNYSLREVHKDDLMYMVADQMNAITHSPKSWQNNVIQQLARWGLSINPSDVLSGADYRSYKNRYGYNGY